MAATPSSLAKMILIEVERHMLFAKLNKSSLARKAGISPQRMHAIFNGANITLKTLGKIIAALDVSMVISMDSRPRGGRNG